MEDPPTLAQLGLTLTEPDESAMHDPIVTVFEHHDADGASLDVVVARRRKWEFMTVDEARDLADKLLDAADLAEACSEASEVPLRML